MWDTHANQPLPTVSVDVKGHYRAVDWRPAIAETRKDGASVTPNRLAIGMSRCSGVMDLDSGEFLEFADQWETAITIRFNPDASLVAVGTTSGQISVHDATNGQRIALLRNHVGAVSWLAWSPDGKRIASASADSTIRIWDVEKGIEVIVLTGHQRDVNCLEWSPDGMQLVSCSSDHTIRIWDARRGYQATNMQPGLGKDRAPN